METWSELLPEEKRDTVILLYQNSFSGLFISLITSTTLVFGFESPHLSVIKYYLWVALTVVLGLRLIDTFSWQKQLTPDGNSVSKANRRYLIGVLFTAIIWSIYLFVIVSGAEFTELATTLIVISAMAGGSATILAASRTAAMSYSAILMLPSSIFLLVSGEASRETLGFLGVLFSFVMIISAKKAANFTRQAIRLKHHNRLLVEEMEKEVAKRTEQIHQLSNLDPLTGLYNRNAFIQALRKLLIESKQKNTTLAILFIDLDGFKQVNDALGHKIGDQVLKIITQRLLGFKAKANIGRWGGDEFVLAVPRCDESEALQLAKKIVIAISKFILIDSLKLNIGASVGISFAPLHSQSEYKLIQFADIAMYKQKNSGEQVPLIFSNELYVELQQKEILREGLREAIINNQLFVVYQPIHDSLTQEIVSCEALLRWSFNEKLIPPDIFIKIAEQSGLIIEIGQWVLKQACFDAAAWTEYNPCTISVNVSIVQLLDESFIDFLDDILQQSQLPPERLVLEITESTFIENQAYIKHLLTKIKSRNIGVSIDDFGTGYSSMSQLQLLPFNIIKIDRTFVNNMHDKGKAIIKATLFIAKELNCQTVAEGIETEEQAGLLRELGADYLQGFLFAKPMQLTPLVDLMKLNLSKKSGY